MQIITGNKRQVTLMQWNEILQKAEKELADSRKCYELYGDEDSKQWIKEDQEKVDDIKQQIEKVIAFMDEHNIQ